VGRGGEVIADPDQARTLARIVEIREQQKALEAEGDRLVDVLKFSLAGASRLIAPGVGKVLWTAPSSRSTTAWKDVAAVLAGQLPEGSLEAAVEAHTRTDDGIRQFRITPAKEPPHDRTRRHRRRSSGPRSPRSRRSRSSSASSARATCRGCSPRTGSRSTGASASRRASTR
jgi:hypothetical protein